MGRCLVATADLMGYSRLAGVVRSAGLTPVQVRGADGIRDARGPDVGAVIVDLTDPHGGTAAIEAAAALDLPVIAIGPHVRQDLFDAARTAGARHVLPHSAVAGKLGPLLQETHKGTTNPAPGP